MIYINKIMKLKLNERYEIMEDNIRDIKFDDMKVHREGVECTEYSWSLSHIHSYGRMYTFPMRSANYVKTFKTLMGAKRNFIKWLKRNHAGVIHQDNPLERLKARYET